MYCDFSTKRVSDRPRAGRRSPIGVINVVGSITSVRIRGVNVWMLAVYVCIRTRNDRIRSINVWILGVHDWVRSVTDRILGVSDRIRGGNVLIRAVIDRERFVFDLLRGVLDL